MSLISKYRLHHPVAMTIIIAGMSIISVYGIFNAINSGFGINDMWPGFLPVVFTFGVVFHTRFPTKAGWWMLFIILSFPIPWGIFDGLSEVYSLLISKYSWVDFFGLVAIDSMIVLIVTLFLYASHVVRVKND